MKEDTLFHPIHLAKKNCLEKNLTEAGILFMIKTKYMIVTWQASGWVALKGPF